MGKSVNDLVLDAAHDYVISNGNKQVACSAEPTTYAEATSTYMLAEVALASGDYTKAAGAGTPAGRKCTVAAKNGVTITNSGTATHIAIVDTVNSALLRVTTCTSLSLTAGQTVNFGSWSFDIDGPT